MTFTPDAGITSFRIQVKSLGGTLLYDSGWVSGMAPITWQAVDENGIALPADVYPTHIEVRTARGNSSEDGSLQLVADTPVVASRTDPSPVQPKASATATPPAVRGQGTPNRIVRWITDKTIGDSLMTQSGTTISMQGTFTSTNTSGAAIVGTSQSGAGVRGNGTSGYGLRGVTTTGIGVSGESSSGVGVSGSSGSTASGASAILGTITSTSPGGFSAGVCGINNGTGGSGIGVYGAQAGGGYGVYGSAPSGYGVVGSSTSGYGVYGVSSSSDGVFGITGRNTVAAGLFQNNDVSSPNRGVAVRGLAVGGALSDIHPSGAYYDAAGEL